MEVQRGEREVVERELAGCRVRLEQMASQSSAQEARLSRAESEREGRAGELAEWTNQIAALKKEAEQWQQRASSLEDSLTREKVRKPLQLGHWNMACLVAVLIIIMSLLFTITPLLPQPPLPLSPSPSPSHPLSDCV